VTSALISNVLGGYLPTIDYAEGVWLVDTTGKRYLDGCSGAVVSLIGHSHPRVIEAITQQSQRATFAHRGSFTNEPLEEIAERLTTMTGHAGLWFVNSGSEAVEAAMQFALQYFREIGEPQRTWFLSHAAGYHGNTLGALSLSGHARRDVVGNLSHDFPALRAPYAFRDAPDLTDEEYCALLLKEARIIFEKRAHETAAVILEPVGGATVAATVPPDGYWQGIRALCDEFGVLLIADEVMTGMGRTGTLLATEHWGVHADIVAFGKGLGSGYAAIAAVALDERVLNALIQGSGRIKGGHTYSGNPLVAAAALAVLNVIVDEDVIARGRDAAVPLAEGLRALQAVHPLVADARGLGMLQAIELDASLPSPPLAQGMLAARLATATTARGLLVYPATGGFNDAVLIAPPLTITHEEVATLLEILDAALSDVEAELL